VAVWARREPVPTDAGVAVIADRTFEEVPHPAIVVVPGGALPTIRAMSDPLVRDYVRSAAASAELITSVCTGSLILGAAGFLEGRRAATHWAWRELLPLFGAKVDEGRVCRDGDLITGGGVTAGLDFAFTLLAELAGETTAKTVQLGLEYAPDPPFDEGRPELAPPEIVDAYMSGMAPLAAKRRAQAAEAARRLKAPA